MSSATTTRPGPARATWSRRSVTSRSTTASTVAWHTLETLAQLLRRHRADDSINKAIGKLIRSDLVVIDDVGLLPVSTDAAEALFRVIDAAYEKRSIAISSNIHPSGFDELMPKSIATATVDRLLHHAHVLITDGQDSYRLAQATAGKGVKPLHLTQANRCGENDDGGEIRWPPAGRNDGHQWGITWPPVGRNRWPLTTRMGCARRRARAPATASAHPVRAVDQRRLQQGGGEPSCRPPNRAEDCPTTDQPENDKRPGCPGLLWSSGGGIRTRDLRVMSRFRGVRYLRFCRAFVKLGPVA